MHGPRDYRLRSAIPSDVAGRLPRHHEPGNALERRRNYGRILAAEHGGYQGIASQGRSVEMSQKGKKSAGEVKRAQPAVAGAPPGGGKTPRTFFKHPGARKTLPLRP